MLNHLKTDIFWAEDVVVDHDDVDGIIDDGKRE